jgi:hypothetical protein
MARFKRGRIRGENLRRLRCRRFPCGLCFFRRDSLRGAFLVGRRTFAMVTVFLLTFLGLFTNFCPFRRRAGLITTLERTALVIDFVAFFTIFFLAVTVWALLFFVRRTIRSQRRRRALRKRAINFL